jgi:hypothetical protein
MGRVNQCKDVTILNKEFSDSDKEPLDITLCIDSEKDFEYSYLSNLLSTYGKLEKLIIDDNNKHAKIKFFKIGSAFRVSFNQIQLILTSSRPTSTS